MADDLPMLTGPDGEGPNRPPLQRRGGPGRPAGSKNRRSLDLARWIAATFEGMTPGQQSAELAMVSAADVEGAADAARELQLVDLGLAPLVLAMVVKATRLAKALRCEPMEAWALMAKERADLMRYVHQAQPQARDASSRPPATVFLVPEGEARDANALIGRLPDDDAEDPDFIDVLTDDDGGVSSAPSHGEGETEQ